MCGMLKLKPWLKLKPDKKHIMKKKKKEDEHMYT